MLITATLPTEPTWGAAKAAPQSSVAVVYAAQHPRLPGTRKWAKRGAISLLLILGALLGSTTVANAWPWDWKDDATAYIVNFCGPQDVPPLYGSNGPDTALGLNNDVPQGSDARKTYVNKPFEKGTGGEGKSFEKLRDMGFYPAGSSEAKQTTGVQGWANNPSYLRYGFNLNWFSYGSSCGDFTSMGMNVINNWLLSLVEFVNMVTMVVIHYALDNVLYTFFGSITGMFTGIFGKIFAPFMAVIAVIGPVYMWFKYRGRRQSIVATSIAWVCCIAALAGFMTQQPERVMQMGNNFVTSASSFAAQKMFASGNMGDQACSTGGDRNYKSDVSNGDDGGIGDSPWGTMQSLWNGTGTQDEAYASDQCIMENLWYGITYQTWANGIVGTNGDAQARYAAPLLNAVYQGSDNAKNGDPAATQGGHRDAWNTGSYAASTDNNKNTRWGKDDQWNKSNFLGIIAAMCGSDRNAGDNSDEANDQSKNPGAGVWKDCRAGRSDNTDSVDRVAYQALTGVDWRGRMIIAGTGLFNAYILALTSGWIALYLIFKKFGFYFTLMFAPIFLAAATWPGERGKAFARKFGEMLFGNVLKQAVAVLMLLFVSYLFALIMTPNQITGLGIPGNGGMPTDLTNTNPGGDPIVGGTSTIPYLIKPLLCLGMLAGLVAFAYPMKQIMTGALTGNVEMAAKYASGGTYLKAAGTAAVVTAAVVATGGAAAAAAGGGKAAGLTALTKSGGAKKVGTTALKAMTNVGRQHSASGKAAAAAMGVMDVNKQKNLAVEDLRSGTATLASDPRSKNYNPFTAGLDPTSAESKARSSMIRSAIAAEPEKYGLKPGQTIGQGAPNEKEKRAWEMAAREHDGAQVQAAEAEQSAKFNKAQDAAQNKFLSNHLLATGQHHPLDPNHPANAADAPGDQAQVTPEQAVRVATARREAAIHNAEQYVDSADYARINVVAVPAQSSTAIHRQMGITEPVVSGSNPVAVQEALAEALAPAIRDFYSNNVGAMDPRHPATPMIQTAMATPANAPDAVANYRQAQSQVAEHGMPALLQDLGTPNPPPDWQAITANGISELPVSATATDRAALLHELAPIAQLVPAETDVSAAMSEYRSALGNPAEFDSHAVNQLAQRLFERVSTFAPNGGSGGTAAAAAAGAAAGAEAARHMRRDTPRDSTNQESRRDNLVPPSTPTTEGAADTDDDGPEIEVVTGADEALGSAGATDLGERRRRHRAAWPPEPGDNAEGDGNDEPPPDPR